MIVLYKNPNTLSLPYAEKREVELKDEKGIIVLGEDNLPKTITKKVPVYFKFVPGKNIITPDLWKKIVKYNIEDWDYYSTILEVFLPIEDKKTGIIIGTDELKIDLNEVQTLDFKELIEYTMDADDLKSYLKKEKSKDRPRKVIIDAIKSQLNQISIADEIINEEK